MTNEGGSPVHDDGNVDAFAFFNEIGIISQLSTALLANALPDGVHPSHFFILNHLARTGDGKTPSRIADAMQVTKGTMTHSLHVLEERGFLRIAANPDDARGKLVHLTDSGRQFRARAIGDVRDVIARILSSEHHELMDRVMSDLITLRKHLDANRL